MATLVVPLLPDDKPSRDTAGDLTASPRSTRPGYTGPSGQGSDSASPVKPSKESNGTSSTGSGDGSESPVSGAGEIKATKGPYVGLCLAAQGDKVVTAYCGTGNSVLLWKVSSAGEIVSSEGRCITPAGLQGGQPMLLRECVHSSAQKWRFTSGRIMSGPLCLTIYGPYTTPGTAMQTWNTAQDPHLADEQFWKLSS
ncbi:ricin-type beta-trefoil lectin domain protein [Streptomyces xanthochromogenes]|uniref:ricin-type beta-trefoil lectin domain protein n=1 Tax=Streptomyces xanthochromogenes TaxID=67384 RepID=UPI00382766F1